MKQSAESRSLWQIDKYMDNLRGHFPNKDSEEYRKDKIQKAKGIFDTAGAEEARSFLGADESFQAAKELHHIQKRLPQELERKLNTFEEKDLIKEVLTTNNEKQHFDNIVFGVSPFNPYFSSKDPDALPKLISYGLQNYKTVRLYVPDEPSAYSKIAMGYDEERAKKSAEHQYKKYLKGKILEACIKNGLSLKEAEAMIVDSAFLSNNEIYNNLHQKVVDLFNADEDFAQSVREASWDCYLKAKTEYPTMGDMPKEKLDTAAQYLLAETPLFFKSAEILGTKDSVFAYHQLVDYQKKIYSKMFANEQFDFVPGSEQGYAVLNQFPEEKPKNKEI